MEFTARFEKQLQEAGRGEDARIRNRAYTVRVCPASGTDVIIVVGTKLEGVLLGIDVGAIL